MPGFAPAAPLVQTVVATKPLAEGSESFFTSPPLETARFLSLQWESRVTQYERDFERISAVIRKEVIRFEVRLAQPSVCNPPAGWP